MLKYVCRIVSFLPGRRNWAPRCQVWRSWSTEQQRCEEMIVCIPGARWLILWPTSEVRGAWLTVLGLSFDSPGYIDEVAPKWSRFCVLDIHYFTPRTSRLSPITSHYERQPVATNDCSGKYAVFSGTQSSGPWASMDLGPPVNDNHYRYRLQTWTSMIIVVIYIHKPKWEWLSLSNGER